MEHGAGNINPQRPVETWKFLGVIIGHELLKQEGNIHVNIPVNVARLTTVSLTSDKTYQFNRMNCEYQPKYDETPGSLSQPT